MLVTAEYVPFFTASVGAAAALIGLLFVSVSIAPDRVFGEQADSRRLAQAVSAFSALANIFFISLAGLIPGVLLGVVVTAAGTASSLQTLSLLRLLPAWRADRALYRGGFLFLASGFVYGFELYLGIGLWIQPSTGKLIGLLGLILGAYAIGLGRAWELLGAPRLGLVTYLLGILDRRGKGQPPPKR